MANNAPQAHAEREFEFSDREFQFLAKLANSKTGIVLAEHKRDMVYGRLVRRLRALKLPSFAAYCDYLEGPEGEDEVGNLINAITTNLTSFFREKHHFEHLRDQVVKPLMEQARGPKRLRLWSAGCSAGMESYSMAMVVAGALGKQPGWDAKILATDIDTNMVATGARGDYAVDDVEDVPKEYRRFMIEQSDGRAQMGPELQSLLSFKRLNLLEPWPMKGPFDAIFCRNVVIYFDKPTKQKLFARMAELLKPNGWLYIGHSENLHGICDRFKSAGRTIYRRVD